MHRPEIAIKQKPFNQIQITIKKLLITHSNPEPTLNKFHTNPSKMRGSNSNVLQILSKRQRRAPTCSQSARKMLTKHGNAWFPGPMSLLASGSTSKAQQRPQKFIEMFSFVSKTLQGPQKTRGSRTIIYIYIFFCYLLIYLFIYLF